MKSTQSVFYEKTKTILFSSLSGYKEAKITHVVCSMIVKQQQAQIQQSRKVIGSVVRDRVPAGAHPHRIC
jgi:hypothetical protein